MGPPAFGQARRALLRARPFLRPARGLAARAAPQLVRLTGGLYVAALAAALLLPCLAPGRCKAALLRLRKRKGS